MAYTRENGIMSDGFTYEGKHRSDEVICTITWCIDDLLDMMERQGIELTDENIDYILGQRFEPTLQDRSIEEGWEIIDILVANAMYDKARYR